MSNDFGPSFWSGIIYIIIVALIMTIFELVFFTVVAAPGETSSATKYLQSINSGGDNLSHFFPFSPSILGTASGQISKQLNDILNVSIAREKKLDTKINNDAVAFICLEMFILILLIIIVWFVLKESIPSLPADKRGDAYFWQKFSTGIQPSLWSAVFACLIIIAFQGSMYDFGKNHFTYPGNNELQYQIITKLQTDLNISSITKPLTPLIPLIPTMPSTKMPILPTLPTLPSSFPPIPKV